MNWMRKKLATIATLFWVEAMVVNSKLNGYTSQIIILNFTNRGGKIL